MIDANIFILVLVVILAGVIVMLFLERSYLIEQHTKEKDKLIDELSKAIKAVIAKNAHDYVMTASIDKVNTEELKEEELDEIPLDALSDDDFDKAIGIKRDTPKK